MSALLFSQLLGTPTESDLGFVRNEDAKRYIAQLPRHPRQSLASAFPHVHPSALDLIEKMLAFDPTKRISGKYSILKLIFIKPIPMGSMSMTRSSNYPFKPVLLLWFFHCHKHILSIILSITSVSNNAIREELISD